MKPSQYNCSWENEKQELVIHNTYTGAMEIVSGAVRELVSSLLSGERLFTSDLVQLHTTGLAMRLYSAGFLVDDERDECGEMQADYLRNKFGMPDHKKWDIAIAPTMACNFDCTYCYAAVKRGAIMSREVEARLTERIFEYLDSSGVKAVNTNWIGGEPLINVPAMRRISEKLYTYCGEKKM